MTQLPPLPVRFFVYDPESDEETPLIECDERTFLEGVEAGHAISYERHTVRENGVSQICLTVGLPTG